MLAVFRRSAYLASGEHLLCLGGPALCAGPLNLVLDGLSDAALSALTPGERWRLHRGVLVLDGGGRLPLGPRRRWRAPAPPDAARMRAGLHRARNLCAAPVSPPRGIEQVEACRLSRGSAALYRWLRRRLDGDGDGCDDGIAALIGCGGGLTPRGDDRLVGVLVLLHAVHRRDVAGALGARVLRHARTGTGRISRAHLQAAVEGEGVAPLHAFLDALLRDAAGVMPARLAALLAHGHDSGGEALYGLRLAGAALCRARTGAAGASGMR